MKRLLLVAVMVLVSLVGVVGFSPAAELQNIQQSICQVIECIEVSALQSTPNPTTGAVNELLETVYDLDTVYDWDRVYDWEKVYAMLETGYDLDTVYDWDTVYDLEKVYARVPARAKMYYITKNTFDGSDAIKACDTGFHMGSISEIQDSSSLQYVNRSISVYDSLVDDEGLGPPSNHMGWVRSGVYPPSGFVYDCEDFQDIRDNHAGTTLVFKDSSEVGAEQTVYTPSAWWQAALQSCTTQPEPVWCVEDPA